VAALNGDKTPATGSKKDSPSLHFLSDWKSGPEERLPLWSPTKSRDNRKPSDVQHLAQLTLKQKFLMYPRLRQMPGASLDSKSSKCTKNKSETGEFP
jgi:hypothetical protein